MLLDAIITAVMCPLGGWTPPTLDRAGAPSASLNRVRPGTDRRITPEAALRFTALYAIVHVDYSGADAVRVEEFEIPP